MKRLLFLQLPQPENAVDAARENVPLAAAYLRWALNRSPEGGFWRTIAHPPGFDAWDDRRLIAWIGGARPDAVAVTLYLWNVERSLDLLEHIRGELPRLRVIAGGPEVAADHPFMFKSGALDAAVTGEGEGMFARILSSLRCGRRPVLPCTGWRMPDGRFVWGDAGAEKQESGLGLPPPAFVSNRPDANGMAYIETGRGCALRCTFCCYNQRRRKAAYLDADAVIRRVAILVRRGARDIRFVDPTFNANPNFEPIVKGLAEFNRRGRVRFFAELRGDTVTREQAQWLARANFTEIEVGVQSRDAKVLRAVRRPTRIAALDAGVEALSRAGIRLTLDVMAGLPGQTPGDVRRSVRWACTVARARVQVLQALLLPGTELRRDAERAGIEAQVLPPYRVQRTRTMSAADFAAVEDYARRVTGEIADVPTRRFVGSLLPDLFAKRVTVDAAAWRGGTVPGGAIRCALILRGRDLFSAQGNIVKIIRRAIRDEPHGLWQFVLAPEQEEPLDLLERVTEEIGRFPPHFLDRMVYQSDARRHVARRLFVILRPEFRYDRPWIRAAEEFLRLHYW